MIIHIELSQSTDVDAEFAVRRKCVAQFFVEAVYALNHEDGVIIKLQAVPVVDPPALHEIKGRQLHSLAPQQGVHI